MTVAQLADELMDGRFDRPVAVSLLGISDREYGPTANRRSGEAAVNNRLADIGWARVRGRG